MMHISEQWPQGSEPRHAAISVLAVSMEFCQLPTRCDGVLLATWKETVSCTESSEVRDFGSRSLFECTLTNDVDVCILAYSVQLLTVFDSPSTSQLQLLQNASHHITPRSASPARIR